MRVDESEEAQDMVDQNSKEKLGFVLGSQPRVPQSPRVQGRDQRCASLEKLARVLRWRWAQCSVELSVVVAAVLGSFQSEAASFPKLGLAVQGGYTRSGVWEGQISC